MWAPASLARAASRAHLAASLKAWLLLPPPVVTTDLLSQRTEAFEAEPQLTLLLLLFLLLSLVPGSHLGEALASGGCWKLLGLAGCGSLAMQSLLVPLGTFASPATEESAQ